MNRSKPCVIPLSQDKAAFISWKDFDRVSRFKWTAHKGSRPGKWYAVRNATVNGKRVWIRMHRFIFDLPPGSLTCEKVVDHKNGDGLDNRRGNLRIVTRSKNAQFAAAKRTAPEPYL